MKNPFKNMSTEAKAGAALCLGAVVIFTSAFLLSTGEESPSSITSGSSSYVSHVETPSSSTPHSIPDTPIVDVMEEEIIRPYEGNPEVMRYFYDAQDAQEIRLKAIVKVEGKTSTYIRSKGNDYAYSDGKEFPVVASLSGTVVDKFVDPTYGNVLVIEHRSGIQMLYASLGNMSVNKNDEVKQGDKIATSGTSKYTEELKSSLHFEILKDGENQNPEKCYSTSVKNL